LYKLNKDTCNIDVIISKNDCLHMTRSVLLYGQDKKIQDATGGDYQAEAGSSAFRNRLYTIRKQDWIERKFDR